MGFHQISRPVWDRHAPRPRSRQKTGATASELPLSTRLRDTKECAVTSETITKREQHPAERIGRAEKLLNLDVWARSAPIRLAGYEDDLAEPHILQGID